jgi:hypothetical protein
MADQFWVRPAKDEEKGSFCDTTSEIHYYNLSKAEAEDEQERSMYRGEAVVEVEDEISAYSDEQRFNAALTDVDRVGYDYPAKYNPGR